MQLRAVFVPDAVGKAYTVINFLQSGDAFSQFLLVFVSYGLGYHVKSVGQQGFLGVVSQDSESRPVDAEDSGAVQCMAHYAAVHGGKKHLQGMVFPDDLLLIGPLLGDVHRHAHGSHDGAIQVIEGGFVGGEQFQTFAGLNGLL